jgi:hypothetical protein
MRVNRRSPPTDERAKPDERCCEVHRWPRMDRRRRDVPATRPLTADLDPAAAVSLGNGGYRMRAVLAP